MSPCDWYDTAAGSRGQARGAPRGAHRRWCAAPGAVSTEHDPLACRQPRLCAGHIWKTGSSW